MKIKVGMLAAVRPLPDHDLLGITREEEEMGGERKTWTVDCGLRGMFYVLPENIFPTIELSAIDQKLNPREALENNLPEIIAGLIRTVSLLAEDVERLRRRRII